MKDPLANIKNAFDFGRAQEKKIFTQLKRLFIQTKATIEYINKKSDKRFPHDFKISLAGRTVTLDVETTPLTSPWHQRWIDKGTVKEVLNRGLRMPLRKFNKQTTGLHLYLKFGPDRKHFFCFVFPEASQHLKDGKKDRRNNASHIKPNNTEFKVIPWAETNNLKACVIIDDFHALKGKIKEMLTQ